LSDKHPVWDDAHGGQFSGGGTVFSVKAEARIYDPHSFTGTATERSASRMIFIGNTLYGDDT